MKLTKLSNLQLYEEKKWSLHKATVFIYWAKAIMFLYLRWNYKIIIMIKQDTIRKGVSQSEHDFRTMRLRCIAPWDDEGQLKKIFDKENIWTSYVRKQLRTDPLLRSFLSLTWTDYRFNAILDIGKTFWGRKVGVQQYSLGSECRVFSLTHSLSKCSDTLQLFMDLLSSYVD